MIGVISPGGFDYFLGSANITSETEAPFIPNSNATAAGGDSGMMTALEQYDVHARLAYSPPRSFNANVTTKVSRPWHNGANELASDASTPFSVAKDQGPKYLAGSAENGYSIIQPLITSAQSEGSFIGGTITLSEPNGGRQSELWKLLGHTALEITDGLVHVRVVGCTEDVLLSTGDVIFLPAGTEFSFWGGAAFSKLLYICRGADTLDSILIRKSRS